MHCWLDEEMLTNLDDEFIQGIVARFGATVTRINLSSNGLRGIGNIDKISPCLEKLNLSQNDLIDIRPLSCLATLTELNLSENSVADVSALVSLTGLETLDLSGNNISSLASLAEIAPHLNQLKSLNLFGNPVCDTLGYPLPIFSLFPSLALFDGFERQASLQTPLGAAFSSSSSTVSKGGPLSFSSSSSFSSPADAPSSSSSTTFTALRAQLEAMERAFEMQERALNVDRLDMEAASDAAEAEMGGIEEQPSGNSVPFLKMLQLWRRTALESMTQLSVTQKRLQASLATLKDERAKHGQQLKAQSLTTLSYREKSAATEEKASFWESKVEELETKLTQEAKYRAIVDRERQDSQYKLRYLRSFLDQAKAQMEQDAVGALLRVDQAARSLKSFESRLLQASERVQFAAALVAQKEIILRNTAAAMEAERRIQEQAFSSPRGDENPVLSEAPAPLLSSLTLRPEVEALLRTVFRQLDTEESGAVVVEVLVAYLLSQNTSRMLSSTMGGAQWDSLCQGLQTLPQESTLTWGEFLLQLLPSRSEAKLAGLSARELYDLQASKIWGDFEWGLVPLLLPKDLGELGTVASSALSNPEVRRLHAERAFLLSRVQDMSRTLDRRAEAVKGYFEQDLRRARLKESRLQAQVAELRVALESAEKRLQDASESHNAVHKSASDRAAALEQQLEELQERLSARKDSETQALETSLLEEKTRFTRLETEHSLLQRESSKREIKAKGLQRDVMRLQAQVAQLAEEKSRLQADAEKEKLDQAHEVKSINDAWNTDKQRVIELEMQLELWARRRREEDEGMVVGGQGKEAEGEGEAAAVAAGAEEEEDAGEAKSDEFERVRREMRALRSTIPAVSTAALTSPGTERASTEASPALRQVLSAGGLGQADVYAVHLQKLLRLAEEAINKP